MATAVVNVKARARSYVVATAAPVYIDLGGFGTPTTVTAIPGAGGSLAIAYSTTPGAASLGAAAIWQNWPAGSVAAAASDSLVSPVTALRATAGTAAGTVEVVG